MKTYYHISKINLEFSVLRIGKWNKRGRREGILLVCLCFCARISEFFNLHILPLSHGSNHHIQYWWLFCMLSLPFTAPLIHFNTTAMWTSVMLVLHSEFYLIYAHLLATCWISFVCQSCVFCIRVRLQDRMVRSIILLELHECFLIE